MNKLYRNIIILILALCAIPLVRANLGSLTAVARNNTDEIKVEDIVEKPEAISNMEEIYQMKRTEVYPDLSTSSLSAYASQGPQGSIITFTATIVNTGNVKASDIDVFVEIDDSNLGTPSNIAFSGCGKEENFDADKNIEISNITVKKGKNCMIAFDVRPLNENLDLSEEANALYISPAAEGGVEIGPIYSNAISIQQALPDSEPEPIIELEPEPIIELEPEPEPIVELEPEPEPIIELEPEPIVELEPEPIVELEPEPIIELEPEPIIELEPEPVPCGECDGKINTLTLRYDGEEATNIEVEQNKGAVIFEGEIFPGEVFTLNGEDNNGTFGKKIFIRELGDDGSNCDDGGSRDHGSRSASSCTETEIHTSCSEEILVGMSLGSYTVMAGESLEGGNLCSIASPEPTW